MPIHAGSLIVSRLRRRGWLCFAWANTALGILGIVLPLLPTTPFLLLAVWGASRGAPDFARRIYEDARVKPLLLAWERDRAIPRRAKYQAIGMLGASWLTLWLLGTANLLLAFLALFFLVLGGYLLTRPDGSAGLQ